MIAFVVLFVIAASAMSVAMLGMFIARRLDRTGKESRALHEALFDEQEGE